MSFSKSDIGSHSLGLKEDRPRIPRICTNYNVEVWTSCSISINNQWKFVEFVPKKNFRKALDCYLDNIALDGGTIL